MATINYKEKYEKAVHAAMLAKQDTESAVTIRILEEIFPELKESEDKRIRQKFIHLVKMSNEVGGFALHKWEADEMLAWLEEQAEHANFRNKIQIGDKVTRNKDGVLVNLSQLNRVAKKDERQGEQKSFARYKVGDTIYYDSFGRLVSFVIANIVEDGTDNPMYEDKDGNSVFQNDIVEQKPTNEEMKTLLHTEYEKGRADAIAEMQKPAWSEEDKDVLEDVEEAIINYWHGQSQEDLLDWLKSLRPQSHWKPSDEQMEALEHFIVHHNGSTNYAKDLEELRLQLKKLREE